MVQLDAEHNTIYIKVLYYGPGESGKTTSLISVREAIKHLAPEAVGTDTISIETPTGRTLYYDYQYFMLNKELLETILREHGINLDVSWLSSFKLKVHGWTASGQDLYASLRKPLLKGVDAVIFVVDSQREKIKENKGNMEELKRFLGKREIPIIVQLNKRDLLNSMSLREIIYELGLDGYLTYETVATERKGTLEAFTASILLAIRYFFLG